MSPRFDPCHPSPEETHLRDRPRWKPDRSAERFPPLEWTSLISELRPQLRALACDSVAHLLGKAEGKRLFKRKEPPSVCWGLPRPSHSGQVPSAALAGGHPLTGHLPSHLHRHSSPTTAGAPVCIWAQNPESETWAQRPPGDVTPRPGQAAFFLVVPNPCLASHAAWRRVGLGHTDVLTRAM